MPKSCVSLARREEIARATWSFSLDLHGRPFPFRAGQNIDVVIPNPHYEDAGGNRRTFSIASAPDGDHLLVATRARDSAFKRSLIEAPLGTALEISGPSGSMTLPDLATAAVLIAGGIGVTPFRSMVAELVRHRHHRPLLLLHSCATPEEAPFLLDLERWSAAHPNFVYRPTMTRMERSRIPWSGDRSRIDPAYLERVLPPDRDRPLYCLAGSNGFLTAVYGALTGLGVEPRRVRVEAFTGY